MRYGACVAALLLCLAGCGSHPKDTETLVLVNHFWDHVNVEAVVIKGSECGDRSQDLGPPKEFVMSKGQTYDIDAPNGDQVCWRHDPDPNNPVKGVWSDWSRAVLYPGQKTETDL
jgi:hypothetical protein